MPYYPLKHINLHGHEIARVSMSTIKLDEAFWLTIFGNPTINESGDVTVIRKGKHEDIRTVLQEFYGFNSRVSRLDKTIEDYTLPNLWTSDLWETPENVAKLIATYAAIAVRPLECSAGNGAISKFFLRGTAIEPLRHRYEILRETNPNLEYFSGSFFDYNPERKHDVIVGNPPFSMIPEFLAHIAKVLEFGGLAYLLLPTQSFQAVGRYKALCASQLTQIEEIKFVNRIAFVKNGVEVKGTQQYHSVFVFGHTAAGHLPRGIHYVNLNE
ncbi:putative DNA modification methylase [Acaryochloris phage A-HIS1]|nr:putative DNA modification methylase [Acaryochloris phage A-HIS1]